MSDQVLNILKLFLLALVWLFFLRVLRSVWVEIRSGDAEPAAASGPDDVASRPGAVPAAAVRAAPPAPRPARATRARVSNVKVPTPAPAGNQSRREPGTRLRLVEPAERAGEMFPVDGRTTIGRASKAGIPLSADSYASSDHARVYLSNGGLWVEDNGSTNGTFVNSLRIAAPTPLVVGDRLQVGRTVFEVCP